jgi:hypothetical protein
LLLDSCGVFFALVDVAAGVDRGGAVAAGCNDTINVTSINAATAAEDGKSHEVENPINVTKQASFVVVVVGEP